MTLINCDWVVESDTCIENPDASEVKTAAGAAVKLWLGHRSK